VEYSQGDLRNGEIEVNQSVSDEGKKLVPLNSTPHAETELMEATFTFAPTPISTKSLTFDLTKSQKVTPQGIITEPGDWKITINFVTP